LYIVIARNEAIARTWNFLNVKSILYDYLLEPTEAAEELVIQFLSKTNLPPKAANDAAHIAIATVHGMDYLLTWNCKHIANAHIQKKLARICYDFGYELPTICTPYEMLGE
jgi:hypothetical protein